MDEFEISWKQWTPNQRLSNRTILRFQGIANDLRDDLKELRLFGEFGGVKQVSFVACDTYYPPKQGKNRYYNARLLSTCQFTKDNEALWQWLRRGANLQRFKNLFDATKLAKGGKSHFPAYEALLTKTHADKGDKEKAHDLIINAISVLPYSGLLLHLFDAVFFDEHFAQSLKGGVNDLCRWAEFDHDNASIFSFAGFKKGKVIKEEWLHWTIPRIEVPEAVRGYNDALEALRRDFIEPFMLGETPLAPDELTPASRSPYRQGGKQTHHCFFRPIYDFQKAAGLHGGFLGWLVGFFEHGARSNQAPDDQRTVSNKANVKAALRNFNFSVRNFSRRVREEQMRELVEEDWDRARDATEFTRRRYHQYGGWFWERNCSRLAPPEFPDKYPFAFCREQGGRLVVEDDSDEITHFVAMVSPESSSAETAGEPLLFVFRKRLDTIVPKAKEDLRQYGYWITKSIQDVYQAAHLREAEQQAARSIAAEENYAKTAHQLRKLVRGISKKTPKAELDVLRRYFTLTFLSPKNLHGNATVRFATDLWSGGAFGPDFLGGRTLSAFVRCSYRYASALYPLMEKLHNDTSSSGPKPRRQLIIASGKPWHSPLWSHAKVVRTAATKGQPLDKRDSLLLQTKVFSFAALVALWLNTIEHSPNCSEVFLKIEPRTGRLIMTNRAAPAVARDGSEARSLGTKQTLDYYFRSCFPRGAIFGEVEFPEAPKRHVFTTKLPIPIRMLLCQRS